MWLCYTEKMKETTAKLAPATAPFVKRMATIVFEANVRPKGNVKGSINVAEFNLSDADRGVYAKLSDRFLCAGEAIVSKSAQDIANIMPPAVFLDALPRLVKARALSVTFWEHAASTPKFWRKVKSF